MTRDFEDHCWKDVMSQEMMDLYASYARKVFVGPSPALVAIDLYAAVYAGGNKPMSELAKTHPNAYGAAAWEAIAPTRKLFAAARAAGLPIFYSTGDARTDSHPAGVTATKRKSDADKNAKYAIQPDFKPQPGDVVITKQRASAFYGTPLTAHLNSLGVRSVIMLGGSTSGCLRASAVDAYSNGYHVTLVEECIWDRNELCHKVNLFDMHHKYCDVMHLDEVLAHLDALTLRKAG
jgi:nicotinamidase-related amidase